jgi:urease accessory protein
MIEPGNASSSAASLRLWQLISPALPVGAYAYSQGLEYAIETGWVHDESTATKWIEGLVNHSLARLDIPLLARLYNAWQQQDTQQLDYWNDLLLACRESAEILAEDQHLGSALLTLLSDLEVKPGQNWHKDKPASYAAMFALAACHWHIPLSDSAGGYAWAWCENQVAAAIKLVPLGQTAGQRMLSHLIGKIPDAVQLGLSLEDEEIGVVSQGLGIASALHETQYSRLFRS